MDAPCFESANPGHSRRFSGPRSDKHMYPPGAAPSRPAA